MISQALEKRRRRRCSALEHVGGFKPRAWHKGIKMSNQKEDDLPIKRKFNVNEQLHGLLVPVAGLHEDLNNARSHNEKDLQSISTSYKTFGQQKPIICNGAGKVIAGNGQLEAAKNILGWTHIACIKFDDENEARQMAFAVADNKTAELSQWNFPVLAETLAALSDQQVLLGATGFEGIEIESILANSPWEGLPDDAVPGAYDYKGQQWVRMRIVNSEDIETIMADVKDLLIKYGERLELVD